RRHTRSKRDWSSDVCSSDLSTFCQVLPPSAVRYTPRSGFGAHTWPRAATKTMSGLAGTITIWDTWPTSPRPMNCQLLPASGDMKTPRPSTTSFRGFDSPVPTHTTFGFEGASVTAPIDDVGWSLKTASHESPPSVVFHTPPAAAPT